MGRGGDPVEDIVGPNATTPTPRLAAPSPVRLVNPVFDTSSPYYDPVQARAYRRKMKAKLKPPAKGASSSVPTVPGGSQRAPKARAKLTKGTGTGMGQRATAPRATSQRATSHVHGAPDKQRVTYIKDGLWHTKKVKPLPPVGVGHAAS